MNRKVDAHGILKFLFIYLFIQALLCALVATAGSNPQLAPPSDEIAQLDLQRACWHEFDPSLLPSLADELAPFCGWRSHTATHVKTHDVPTRLCRHSQGTT